MLKKILIYISIFFGLIFAFINGDKINILAYTPVNNTIGTYPLQLDIDNYNTYQLVNAGEIDGDVFNFNEVKSFTFTNYGISLITSDNYAVGSVGTYFNPTKFENVEIGKTYTLSFDITYNNYFAYFKVGNERNLTFSYCNTDSRCNYTFVAENVSNYVIYGYDANSSNVNNIFTIDNFMIYEGEYDSNKTFGTFFKFGYNVGYGLKLFNDTNVNQTTNIQIRDENNNILLNNSVTLAANSNTFFSPNNFVYIPFNIDKNGRFNFNKTLNLYFTNTNIKAAYTSDLSEPSGIYFALTYSAYYKGEYSNKLHFKNTYLLNNISMNGVSINLSNNNVNDSSLIMTGIILSKSNYDDWYKMSGTSNSGSLGEGLIENVSTNRIIETGYYNSLDFSYFDNTAIYSFIIDNPSANGSTSILNDTYITINISSFNARVIGSNSVSPPTSSDSNTIGKYNECEAWYDIPCQLGNAITYVIYEAPIISPIINFFDGFIDLVQSFVTYITWFEGLGLIFGIFIVIFFIRMIILLVKGGNDD